MRSALERREKLLCILSARREEKINNLAIELNVSRRTVERDISYLKLNYNIDSSKGKGGGVYFYGRYSQRYLTDKQEKLLMELSEELNPDDTQTIKDILAAFSINKKNKKL